jgi:hypothetical protein
MREVVEGVGLIHVSGADTSFCPRSGSPQRSSTWLMIATTAFLLTHPGDAFLNLRASFQMDLIRTSPSLESAFAPNFRRPRSS